MAGEEKERDGDTDNDDDVYRIQERYKTVAEALQAAVLSLLKDKDEDMNYKRSFYYWAGIASHGFAGVKLDDALLGQIHSRLRSSSLQGPGHSGTDDGEGALTIAMTTLTRNAYRSLEHQEQTLLREWRDKWDETSSD